MNNVPHDRTQASDWVDIVPRGSRVVKCSSLIGCLSMGLWYSQPYPPSDDVQYSVKVPNSEKPGYGAIRRNNACPNGVVDKLGPPYDHLKTMYEAWRFSVDRFPKKNCLGHRVRLEDGSAGEYSWRTYEEIDVRMKNVAAGMRANGLKKGTYVGLYGKNCPEWTTSFLAAYSQSCVCVPLYDTLGPNVVSYICDHASLNFVFLARENLEPMLEAITEAKTVKVLVLFEDCSADEVARAKAKGVVLKSFSDIMQDGINNPVDDVAPKNEDLAVIMYTSGTTGNPKGVMITHRNILAAAGGWLAAGVLFDENDCHLSYLPLAHIFEMVVQLCMLGAGGQVGFYQGDVKKVVDDIGLLRPTVFCGVPRVYTRIYDRLTQQLDDGGMVRKAMFEQAFSSKLSALRSGTTAPFWDYMVFSKVRARLGGRVRLVISGGAPLPQHIQEFMQVCFCADVLQGFGMTETAACATLTNAQDFTTGHVGPPAASTEIKLADVTEMGYTSKDEPCPRGEILLKGANIFSGYYRAPELTKEAFDEDGWFHTGDIGRWNKNGTLSIIDRKKNIFKLAQGEYVAAEYLEGVYTKSGYVSQMFVYGDSYKNNLVAVVCPDKDVLFKYAREKGLPEDTEQLAKRSDIKTLILDDIEKIGQQSKVKGYERIKRIHIEGVVNDMNQGFTVDNGFLTPTFKLRRKNLLDGYINEINAMYNDLGEGNVVRE